MRWFEDFVPGDVHHLGTCSVTEEAILAFGREFDPQPFHVDPEAARVPAFGGLIASGWHTGSEYMRLVVEGLLRGEVHVEDTQASSRRADRGTVFFRAQLHNQDDLLVMRLRSRGLFGRRSPD